MQHLPTNTLLQGGKYKIERVLGQGGFGITYLAVQVMLDRKVCIKEFFFRDYCDRNTAGYVTSSTASNREIVDRFLNKFLKEARIISRLDHSNIIRILDIFEENGTAYYVMEYIDGCSLEDKVNRQGVLSEAEAVEYIKQVGSALDYIHQNKINHLDVKPANIMIRRSDDKAILIDFGVSKQYDIQGSQTSTTPVGISHGYAPIEQYNAGGVSIFSPQTDVYSLGATLYKLVTGHVPPMAIEIFNEGLTGLPNSLSSNIKEAVRKAMQLKKADRPQSIIHFLSIFSVINTKQKTSILNLSNALIAEETSIIEPTNAKNRINGHEFVDLGLSVKWATCNIGADQPHEYGNYYSWGETTTKMEYSEENSVLFGKSIFDIGGNINYDAATANWGEEWRLPTIKEMVELVKICESNIVKQNGVNGCKFIGPNGNSIFLPASGVCDMYSCEMVGESGVYWGASPCNSDDNNEAYGLMFTGGGGGLNSVGRSLGLTIRPVYNEKKMINGHEYVDLGLSVKWATCNIGANAPYELGNLYSWGEASTKKDYTIDNCKTIEVQKIEKKSFFGTKTQEVIVDKKENFIDTVRANWGGNWRMPTHLEIDELANKCTWEKTKINGKSIYKVTGPNGNSIFVCDPETCIQGQDGLVGSVHCFWSSTPYKNNEACYLFFFSNYHYVGSDSRYKEHAVRPVVE